jgi:hypothetical protein
MHGLVSDALRLGFNFKKFQLILVCMAESWNQIPHHFKGISSEILPNNR